MARQWMSLGLVAALLLPAACPGAGPAYPIVGTGQVKCYSDVAQVDAPKPGQPFYGQDAQQRHPAPSYKDNGDGTISDLVTGLEWVKARGAKVTYPEAVAGAGACRIGSHADWRMPTIKELYSLIRFDGSFDPMSTPKPFIDTRVFGFAFGDTASGERPIDCQDWSATPYTSTTMNGNPTIFGVNFADGRIKGYPRDRGPRGINRLYVRYVRGNPAYGKNLFHDNGDGTITDAATGLMWPKADSGKGMDWQAALAWVQARNAARYLGHNDWRLPTAKELQSLVDYTRSPAATKSPAIDPQFEMTRLQDGEYPCFWSSTTHLDGPPMMQAAAAVYVAFGRALGWMQMPPGSGMVYLMDVHGAGAQRSDPKAGDPAYFPYGRGPQGDVIRIYNYVRCVRTASGS